MRVLLSFLQKHFSAICYPLQMQIAAVEYWLLDLWWALNGYRKPTPEDATLVALNVTFMFKSFERQKQAKALYKSIRHHYPGVSVVVADDSSNPFELDGENNCIIQMPFNSGLSKGLNLALAEVKTPYLMRMDDDELLTRRSDIAGELRFLIEHPEVDLVAIPCIEAPRLRSLKKYMQEYYGTPMKEAPLPLKVPHGTRIDDNHIVLGKLPNRFLARTESIRKVGWDDNIRMIDHYDFFFRAAGVLVSAVSTNSIVFHNHNHFSTEYNRYRSDWKRDALYIRRTRYGSRTKSTSAIDRNVQGKDGSYSDDDNMGSSR